ncbi:antitoxin [Ruminococcaceae bacterium OttesenSCG-928-A16]|nr:antitoxin [Ruminococcaceae bacterium OttesenSCG-928-A16]
MDKPKASTRAKNKYNSANYDRIATQVKKGMRDELRVAAENKGYPSLNRYIVDLLEKDTGLKLL